MSRYGHNMPQPEAIDQQADRRQREWDDLCLKVNWAAVTNEFLAKLRDSLEQAGSPLAEHVTGALQDAPLYDEAELEGWCQHTRLRVAEKIGRFIMRLYGEAQLAVMARADDRPF